VKVGDLVKSHCAHHNCIFLGIIARIEDELGWDFHSKVYVKWQSGKPYDYSHWWGYTPRQFRVIERRGGT